MIPWIKLMFLTSREELRRQAINVNQFITKYVSLDFINKYVIRLAESSSYVRAYKK